MTGAHRRPWSLALLGLLAACAAGPEARPGDVRLFAEPAQALVPGARPFAMGADARGVYATQLGSWTEPLMATGMVVRTGPLERGPVQVGVPEWLGMHELVLRQGDEHVVLQYDAPAAPAPVRRGETIRVYALTTRVGPRLAFAMSVFDARGDLTMAGLRTPRASQELLPPGWWVEFGPTTRTSPLCDGHLAERAVRVRGPGGEAVVAPGWTSVAALGRDGTRYAVDVARSHRAEATCPQAEAQTDLSVVIRRLEG